jgi:hypothetical protein
MHFETIHLMIGIVFIALWLMAGKILVRQHAACGKSVKTSAAYRRR